MWLYDPPISSMTGRKHSQLTQDITPGRNPVHITTRSVHDQKCAQTQPQGTKVRQVNSSAPSRIIIKATDLTKTKQLLTLHTSTPFTELAIANVRLKALNVYSWSASQQTWPVCVAHVCTPLSVAGLQRGVTRHMSSVFSSAYLVLC